MLQTGVISALMAALSWGFVEGFGRFYPSKGTWWKLRRARGREPLRRTRERFEEVGARSGPRKLALVLVILLLVWVGVAGLLDKRWYEVLADVAPSLLVIMGLLRVPPALRAIAARMKEYERQAGDDPDEPFEGEESGPTAIAL